jgi:aryl-alcohol dehydrogenase-like predicted oxidoreductase
MEERPFGRAGFRVSTVGVCLPADPELAERLMVRAWREGVTVFFGGPAVAPAEVGEGALRVRGPVAIRAGEPVPPDAFVVAPFNILDQAANTETLAPAWRGGRGVLATNVLKGGALAGRVGHAPPGAVVSELAKLVTPRRTLAQLSIQFVLASEYVSCAVVRVSSIQHLVEAVGATEAEPLTGRDLEHIFETYANRYDRK